MDLPKICIIYGTEDPPCHSCHEDCTVKQKIDEEGRVFVHPLERKYGKEPKMEANKDWGWH